MKKIDLHIHTVKSSTDADFTFCIDKLVEYIQVAELDGIAVTNHNLFDRNQFELIKEQIDIPVLPGIEIDVEGSQLLLISDGQDLDGFDYKCSELKLLNERYSKHVQVSHLENVFENLNEYIIIPHYLKKPEMRQVTLQQLQKYVTAGEVSSHKKFINCIKNEDRLVPVFFSDCRIKPSLSIPVRQTFIDCDEVGFSAIKSCLKDKNKVALSKSEGNLMFPVFGDGRMLSSGLNVILGDRSSGKSHTLKNIRDQFDNVRYLEQFSLVARNEDEDKKRFNEYLSQNSSLFSKEYLKGVENAVADALDIDLERDERSVSRYLETLFKYANETRMHNSFSKAKLYSDVPFPVTEQRGLKELIQSTKNLVSNKEYREVIDKHVPNENLKALYVDLIQQYLAKEEERRKKIAINALLREIQAKLETGSSTTKTSDFDPYRVMLNRKKSEKFDALIKASRKSREVLRDPQRGFVITAEVGPFTGAGELRSVSKSKVAFKEVFADYDRPFVYLQALKNKLNDSIPNADFFKYFVKIDFRILNKDGFDASGGERSEFFLLQAIEGAKSYDMLLLDEPESSFDNIFLKNEVNEILKQISKDMPVVLVTHNSTVGGSIRPDYLLCTQKEIEGSDVKWRVYSGKPTSKMLKSTCGKTLNTREVLMKYLEAGETAYEVRRQDYEDLRN